MTQQIRDTFIAHEHLAPDADLAMDGIAHRIRTRRQSRIAIAGAVAAVVAVATVVPLGLSGHRGSPTRTSAATRPPAPVSRPPALGADYLTIAAGWLPPGRVDPSYFSNGSAGQEREYNIATTDGQHLTVSLALRQDRDRDVTSNPPASTTTRITIDPRELTAGDLGCSLTFAMPYSTFASVQVGPNLIGRPLPGPSLSASESASQKAYFASLCRRVAQQMQFDRHDPIGSDYRPTYAPRGTAVRDITRQDGYGKNLSDYVLASTADFVDPHAVPVELNEMPFTWHQYTGGKKDSQPPLRLVHGHRVYSNSTSKHSVLFIDSIRPGVSILIEGSGVPRMPLQELFKVADGLTFS